MHLHLRVISQRYTFNMAPVSLPLPLPQRLQDVNRQARLKLNHHHPAS